MDAKLTRWRETYLTLVAANMEATIQGHNADCLLLAWLGHYGLKADTAARGKLPAMQKKHEDIKWSYNTHTIYQTSSLGTILHVTSRSSPTQLAQMWFLSCKRRTVIANSERVVQKILFKHSKTFCLAKTSRIPLTDWHGIWAGNLILVSISLLCCALFLYLLKKLHEIGPKWIRLMIILQNIITKCHLVI